MDTTEGYWRFVQMDRNKMYKSPFWCRTIDTFDFIDCSGLNGGPVVFSFDNGTWRVWFNQSHAPYGPIKYYYNDQEVQPEEDIRIKDGDRLLVIYDPYTYRGEDVYIVYKEDTLYWSVQWLVTAIQRQISQIEADWGRTTFQLKCANTRIDQYKELEVELRKQIASQTAHLQQQQHIHAEQGPLAIFMKTVQGAAEQESAKKANLDEIRKQKEVEAELRKQITVLQGALQWQEDVKEREASLQFPAILEQKKLQSVQIIEEMASIWERERSQLNEKIAKLTRQLELKQDRDLLRKQQAMAAVAMLNQSLQPSQVLEGCEDDTDDEATVPKEEHWPDTKESIVSESDISIQDNNNCVICEAELGENSTLKGFQRYCQQCANK